MRISLTVTAGPHKGKVFTFVGHDTFIVGRSKMAHFQLPFKDKYFSRIHFLVEINPPYCRLMDMGSRNGTFVNGAKVTVADLKNGDRIKGGRTILRVAVESEREIAAVAAPPRVPAPVPVVEVRPVPSHPARAASPAPPAAAAAALGSLVPRKFAKRASAAQQVDEPAAAHCEGCGDPLRGEGVVPVQGQASTLSICPICWEEIRKSAPLVPGYQIIRKLGQGGMGVVYLAIHEAQDELVALKTIIPEVTADQGEIDRFIREASILRELDHPRIVAFRDFGQASGRVYFVMDYVRGKDTSQLLASHVKDRGVPLPIDRAVNLTCQALEGLEYAHAKGFVHRDIKPQNLLVTEVEGSESLKLADFGLARFYDASQLSGLTVTGDRGGTPAFIAPEQIVNFRDVRPAADQYSIAATLYNLLTAQYIHDLSGQVQVQLSMLLTKAPVPIQLRREDIPARLAEIIHRALATDPAKRFPDVRAFRQALLPFRS